MICDYGGHPCNELPTRYFVLIFGDLVSLYARCSDHAQRTAMLDLMTEIDQIELPVYEVMSG